MAEICDACKLPESETIRVTSWQGSVTHALCDVCRRLEILGIINHWGERLVIRRDDHG